MKDILLLLSTAWSKTASKNNVSCKFYAQVYDTQSSEGKLCLYAFQALIQLDLPALAGVVVSESVLMAQLCKNFLIVGVKLDVLACKILVNPLRMCTLGDDARASTHTPSQ